MTEGDWELVVVTLGMALLFGVVLGLSFFGGGAVIYFGWNYGLVPVAHIAPVGYWAACCLGLILGLIRSVLAAGRSAVAASQ